MNPDIDAKSHPHISTGLKINKFGIPLDDGARAVRGRCARRPALEARRRPRARRIANHDARAAPSARAALAADSRTSYARSGVALEYVDLGGGLGDLRTTAATCRRPTDYATALVDGSPTRPVCRSSSSRDARLRGPPARSWRASIDIKPRTADSDFAVLDAGMTELMRPALYGAFHRIEPVGGRDRLSAVRVRRPRLREQRRRRARPHAAARSRSAISSRSATPAPTDRPWHRITIGVRFRAEVLVDDGRWRVVRRRQTMDDMLALEVSDAWPDRSSRSKGSIRAASRRRPSCCAIA